MSPREDKVFAIIKSGVHNLSEIARVSGVDKTNVNHVLEKLGWMKLVKNTECKECGRKGYWIETKRNKRN